MTALTLQSIIVSLTREVFSQTNSAQETHSS